MLDTCGGRTQLCIPVMAEESWAEKREAPEEGDCSRWKGRGSEEGLRGIAITQPGGEVVS